MPPRYIAIPFTSGGAVLPIPTPTMTASPVSGTSINLAILYAGPPGVSSYSYEQASAAVGPFIPIASGTSAQVQVTGLTPSATYFFRGRVQVSDGRFSDYPPTVSATTLASAPTSVTGVDAVTTGQTTVTVTWNASQFQTGYHVYRNGVLILTTTLRVLNDTGLTAGTVYTYVVAAFNAAGEGPTGQDTTQTSPVVTTSGLRQNYGIYPSFYYAGGINTSHFNNSDHGVITASSTVPQIKGFAGQFLWRQVDTGGASAAVYDWTIPDAYLAACKAAGKQCWFRICEAFISNGASVATNSKVCPNWVSNVMGGTQFSTINYNAADNGGGVLSKRYSTTLVNLWIAFLKAFVARYDSDPFMEGFTIYEESAMDVDQSGTSVTVSTPGADFSEQGCMDQLLRIIAAVRDPNQINCQKMNVCVGVNYLFRTFDTQPKYDQLYTALKAAKMGAQGPDTFISSWTCPNTPLTNINFPQQNANSPNNTKTSTNPNGYQRSIASDTFYRGWKGGHDYRGELIWAPDCEVTDMGGYITKAMNPVPTAADLFATRISYDKPHYFSFNVITRESGYTGNGTGAFPGAGPDQQWSTGSLPWLKSLSLPTIATPSPY
jgi:chitodextrinase